MKKLSMNLRQSRTCRRTDTAARNRGAALIVVIVCMLFVGVIASIVLSIATSNMKNMTLFSRSAENFYTAENAVDELKASLQEYADKSVRYAYKNWLQQYSYLSHAEQTQLFQDLFLDDFYEILKASVFSAGTMSETTNVTTGAITVAGTPLGLPDLLSDDYTASNIEWDESPVIVKQDDRVTMTVSVKYTEEDGTVSTISTDLVFTLENPDFQINTVSGLNTEVADFAIVADRYISNNSAGDVAAQNGGVEIHGSLYGGGDTDGYGFDFANVGSDSIALRSDKILTRTTLRISNGASISIRGNSDYATTPAEIWARNVLLANTGTGTAAPKVWVTGDMYLADDLTLSAPGSAFRFQGRGSRFYGYGASEDDAANSSAIIINGIGSVLDMTEPDPLYGGRISISGKSFISVPSKFGANASVLGTMLQGESIAFKGEQAAYLLPGECVIGIGHNPMTEDEFAKISNGSDNVHYTEDAEAGRTCFVNIDKSAVNGGIDLGAYLQASRAVKVMRVKYDNATTMVYLYLNFRDSASATAYFEQYARFNPDLVADRVQSIVDKSGNGGIKINALALETTGNTVHTNDDASSLGNLLAATKRSSDTSMVMAQWQYATYFNGLINNLSKEYIGLGTQTYLTDNLVNMSMLPSDDFTISAHGTHGQQIKVKQADGTVKDKFSRGTSENSYYLYTGRNINVNTNTAGIIIASGDVTITAAQFTGLIIARGKVVFSGTGDKCYSDPENILYIMQNCDDTNADETGSVDVTRYFQVTNVTTGSGSGGEVLASDLITIKYENWQKK